MNGGYQVIDLQSKPLTGSAGTLVVIPGIYNAIEGTKKALLVENIVDASSGTAAELRDEFAQAKVVGTDFVITLPSQGKLIVVNDDDEVYIDSVVLNSTVTIGTGLAITDGELDLAE